MPSPDGLHLIASTQGAGHGRVLFIGHHDTVFPPPTAIERPVTVVGDRLLGPGVADMKGGVLVALDALERLAADPAGTARPGRAALRARRGGAQRRAAHAGADARRRRGAVLRVRPGVGCDRDGAQGRHLARPLRPRPRGARGDRAARGALGADGAGARVDPDPRGDRRRPAGADGEHHVVPLRRRQEHDPRAGRGDRRRPRADQRRPRLGVRADRRVRRARRRRGAALRRSRLPGHGAGRLARRPHARDPRPSSVSPRWRRWPAASRTARG